ncbi:MAG TPA: hypothetical protein VG916_15315 [Gemmatimonadaceae bacterium]|nr:hypothetical protein [Gemmatimonadaceae bacterium]
MKPVSSILCIAMIAALGACHDQGPKFGAPVTVAMVPGVADAIKNSAFTFSDGGFFDARFAGAPLKLTLTSSTAFRAEGNSQVVSGTITYPTTSAFQHPSQSGISFRTEGGAPGVAYQTTDLYSFIAQNFLYQTTTFELFVTSPTQSQILLGLQRSLVNSDFNFQTCVGGLGIVIGPYGTGNTGTFSSC